MVSWITFAQCAHVSLHYLQLQMFFLRQRVDITFVAIIRYMTGRMETNTYAMRYHQFTNVPLSNSISQHYTQLRYLFHHVLSIARVVLFYEIWLIDCQLTLIEQYIRYSRHVTSRFILCSVRVLYIQNLEVVLSLNYVGLYDPKVRYLVTHSAILRIIKTCS